MLLRRHDSSIVECKVHACNLSRIPVTVITLKLISAHCVQFGILFLYTLCWYICRNSSHHDLISHNSFCFVKYADLSITTVYNCGTVCNLRLASINWCVEMSSDVCCCPNGCTHNKILKQAFVIEPLFNFQSILPVAEESIYIIWERLHYERVCLEPFILAIGIHDDEIFSS